MIQSSLPTTVESTYDTPINNVKHLKSTPAIALLQPDGVIIDTLARTIQLLEFTRTGDLWYNSLETARKRKVEKYASLATTLSTLHPGWRVTIVPFVIGSRSYLDEAAWFKEWSALGLPLPALTKLLPKVQAWNVEAAKDMLTVRAGIKKGIG